MIPLYLTLKGFLSYREETFVDLSRVDVACVSGANGAGKSSLFDAMTWALFGRARRSDDALINDASESCYVSLEFEYEGNRYRVQREKPRAKGAVLEYQILTLDGSWKPLTEAGLRTTEDRIREVLRLDYDTFINASFFLQGKADMFTQQPPARRKEILSSILGLEVWEYYREEAALRRRAIGDEVKGLRAWLEEVEAELGEEEDRREKLKLLSNNLRSTTALREEKESQFNKARESAQELHMEADKLEIVRKALESVRVRLSETQERIKERAHDLKTFEATLAQAESIEKQYRQWQALRSQLEGWNKLSEKFHALQSQRAEQDALIRSESARLRQEREGLLAIQAQIQMEEKSVSDLKSHLDEMLAARQDLEKRLEELPGLEADIADARNREGGLAADNKSLRGHMDELRKRIDELEGTRGGACPLCNQELTDAHKQEILAKYAQEGKTLGDAHRANEKARAGLKDEIAGLENQIRDLRALQNQSVSQSKSLGELSARLASIEERRERWLLKEKPRLADVEELLKEDSYASQARDRLSALDDEIRVLGYDQEAHALCRNAEEAARGSEDDFRVLEKARTAVDGLNRELAALEESRIGFEEESGSQTLVFEGLQKELAGKKEALPDLEVLERELDNLRTEENQLRSEAGAAQQMVDVLEKQRGRREELKGHIENLNQQISRLRMLETAFGKDGVPALLIEQALPEIETQANEILDRLSDGRMSVSFETEREYKDKKREDKRQTLDILISDSSGRREYELFSGGEAFRINFAIRLALSRVLAGRAGARLQTLVIDEGFGSQDADGRQRLVEAINLVSRDFAKILVITHLDELKDAFPSRIEVTKAGGSSRVEVIV